MHSKKLFGKYHRCDWRIWCLWSRRIAQLVVKSPAGGVEDWQTSGEWVSELVSGMGGWMEFFLSSTPQQLQPDEPDDCAFEVNLTEGGAKSEKSEVSCKERLEFSKSDETIDKIEAHIRDFVKDRKISNRKCCLENCEILWNLHQLVIAEFR